VSDDGTPSDDAPSYLQALVSLEKAEKRLAGADLEVARLHADRARDAETHPLRPQVNLVHACWCKATGKRRPLHFTDVENIAAAIDKFDLATALRCVIGLAYDPYKTRQRNGREKPHNDLDTGFKSFGRVADYAGRAPVGWEPDPEKVAAIAGVEVETVNKWLSNKESK
jgi:hypothetical protein